MLAIKEVSKLRGWKANAGFLTNKLIFHFIQCRDEWQAPCQSLNSSEPGWAPAFKEHTLVQVQGLPDPLGQWKEGAVCAQPAEATLESSRTPESVYSTVSFWIFIRKKCPILWHRRRLGIPFPSPGRSGKGVFPTAGAGSEEAWETPESCRRQENLSAGPRSTRYQTRRVAWGVGTSRPQRLAPESTAQLRLTREIEGDLEAPGGARALTVSVFRGSWGPGTTGDPRAGSRQGAEPRAGSR